MRSRLHPAAAPDTARGPDFAFIPAERLPAMGLPEGWSDSVPSLMAEVVWPPEQEAEVAAKVPDYLAFGVDRLWIVRCLERTVTVLRSDGSTHLYSEGDTLTSDDAGFGVEGFALPVADIFR